MDNGSHSGITWEPASCWVNYLGLCYREGSSVVHSQEREELTGHEASQNLDFGEVINLCDVVEGCGNRGIASHLVPRKF